MEEKNNKKVFVIGSSAVYSLEMSYVRAAKHLGFEILHFDPEKVAAKYVPLGRVGAIIHRFFQVEAWVRKMNRELVVSIKKFQPDFILLATTAPVFYGSLITVKLLSNARIIWIWPDTPMNLTQHNINNGKVIDLTAVYSEKAVEYFSKIGFARPVWVPLAGDVLMHGIPLNTSGQYHCDLAFVGMWRPEREEAMSTIVRAFPNLSIEIYGHYWKRSCKDELVLKRWKGESILGKEMALYFNRCRINLNVIDDTNYPAANMRFFEIPTAGGLELTSSCPEMSSQFREHQEVLYFSNQQELVSSIEWILQNPGACDLIRKQGKEKVDTMHNYVERFKLIINEASNYNAQ